MIKYIVLGLTLLALSVGCGGPVTCPKKHCDIITARAKTLKFNDLTPKTKQCGWCEMYATRGSGDDIWVLRSGKRSGYSYIEFDFYKIN